MTMTLLLFVGCGSKEIVTDNSTETELETNVADVETSTQEESDSQELITELEVVTELEAVAETKTQTEEPY